MNRFLLATKLAVSAVAVGLVTLAASDVRAGAPGVHGVNFLMKSLLDESFCIETTAGTTEGRQVYITKCSGVENQRWTFTDGSDGQSVIVGHLGMCLDIRGHKSGDGTPIQVWRCHYGSNQRFVVTPSGHIKEVASGKCITVGKTAADHKPVYIDECDEQVKQQTWKLVP